ncbi:methanobactin export MATE transporter MbnM [Thalassomonas sp. RHCl1]|uniref:methanobactin export MATE transporter MbnM n=1 Tax=Thalassomonas sp. RHCl1 TaxID=2995320 RepID=UPI00248AC264|nr:methanobactin export MATE transporter MbnM [Thalassomonas sp. RHCl1]
MINLKTNISSSRSRLFILPLLMSFCLTGCGKNQEVEGYQWPIIDGFPKPQVPADNPMSAEKVSLGRMLFYDKNLSANQTQSCASCHLQEYAFAEPLTTSVGSTGQRHRRNAPALVNIAYNKTLTWAHDGLTSIELQLLLPMFSESPVELGITNHEQEVLARFQTPAYRALFRQAFPDNFPAVFGSGEVSFDLITKALASFVRSLISFDSPFDHYAYWRDDSALPEEAIRGMNLFFSERLECHHCHGGFNFTQSTGHEKQLIDRRPFHNIGLYNVDGASRYPAEDNGLAEISTLAADNGRFRAPTLRNVAVTAPYMHDGSIKTLEQVIDFYADGGRNIIQGPNRGDGRKNTLKSPFMKGFTLTTRERHDLLAFLHSLTDKAFLTAPEHAAP